MARQHLIAAAVNDHGWTAGAELGLWYGRIYGYLLESCPGLHLIGVDCFEALPDGMDHYAEWNHASHEHQCREIQQRHARRATLHKMTTDAAAPLVPDGSLDFVFIDADHRTPAVTADIANWLPKIREGGWLMGHDWDWESVRNAVTKRFPKVMVKTGGDNVWWVEFADFGKRPQKRTRKPKE